VAAARGASEKLNACVEKGKKGNAPFPDPAYIRQLTDEYRWAHTVRCTHIFIDFRSKLTNISLYSSISGPTNII
jgi:hypothetical protein